jgi:hypothetical protein
MGAVAEGLYGRATAATKRVDPPPRAHLPALFIHQAYRTPYEQGTTGRDANDRDLVLGPHEDRFRAAARPPLRPAAFF